MDRSKKIPLNVLLTSGSSPPMEYGVGSSIRFRTVPLGRRDDLRVAGFSDGSSKDAPIPDTGAFAVDCPP